MKLLPFKYSPPATMGVELELQIINPHTFSTVSRAKDLIRIINESNYNNRIKPEITQSMIELNSSIHTSPPTLLDELQDIQAFLLLISDLLGIAICGGGTHPFQKWAMQKIYPAKRYKKLSRQYGYLSKRSTVFGQHVHIGCENGDDAIYLTHALARFVPHFIAISASSPFYQGVDTGYHSSRSTVFNAFPLSGVIPWVQDWSEFSTYFYRMKQVGIIENMKDFYWDIRPKPEFGTVEVRVCDTPLTIKNAVLIAAYIQTVAYYLLKERPFVPSPDAYHVYTYNRFQAGRYGFDGDLINPESNSHISIGDDILATMKLIEKHSNFLQTSYFNLQLMNDVLIKQNDATRLRQMHKQTISLPDLVAIQCKIWSEK